MFFITIIDYILGNSLGANYWLYLDIMLFQLKKTSTVGLTGEKGFMLCTLKY